MKQFKIEYTRYNKTYLEKNNDPTISVQLEEQILGLILNHPDHIFKIDDRLFAVEETAELWAKIKELDETSPANLLIAIRQTKYYDYAIGLRNLFDNEHVSSIDKTIFALEDLRLKRLNKLCATLMLQNIEDVGICSEIEQFKDKEIVPFLDLSYQTIMEMIDETVDDIQSGKIGAGYKTGIPELDEKGLISDDDIIGIAARPAMGKTTTLVQLIDLLSRLNNEPCAINSLEIPKYRLITKFISYYSRIPERDIKSNKDNILNTQAVCDAIKKFKELDLEIIEGLYTPKQLETWLRLTNSKRVQLGKKKIKFFAQDYLNIKESGRNLINTKSEIDYVLKEEVKLSKKEKFIPIYLIQIGRAAEARGGTKRPNMSDVKDTGNIEQSMRKLYLIHRPYYYGILEDEQGNSTKNLMEFIVAKNSNGDTGIVNLDNIDLACNKIHNPLYEQTEVAEFEAAYAVNPTVSSQSDFSGFKVDDSTPF